MTVFALLASSTKWLLKLSQWCVSWSFRASFFDDVNSEELDHTLMRKLQKRTNWSSIMRQDSTKNRIDLYDEDIDIFRASMFWVRFSWNVASIWQQISRIDWKIHCEASTLDLSVAMKTRVTMRHNDSCCDSFGSVIDVSQISSIFHLTLRSRWFNIYVVWL